MYRCTALTGIACIGGQTPVSHIMQDFLTAMFILSSEHILVKSLYKGQSNRSVLSVCSIKKSQDLSNKDKDRGFQIGECSVSFVLPWCLSGVFQEISNRFIHLWFFFVDRVLWNGKRSTVATTTSMQPMQMNHRNDRNERKVKLLIWRKKIWIHVPCSCDLIQSSGSDIRKKLVE